MDIYGMQTESMENPIGIDDVSPSFSWKLQSDCRGVVQKNYQIKVAKDENLTDKVWDSGKVSSADTSNIEYSGSALSPSTRYYWNVTAEDGNGKAYTSETAHFETGLMGTNGSVWSGAQWIGSPNEAVNVVNVRKAFDVSKTIKSARLYSSAKGFYNAYINGEKVNDDFYNPGFTDYRLRIEYQTYDITDKIKSGQNVIGAMVGKGYYTGYVGYNKNPQIYGTKNYFIGKLVIEYTDGTNTTIVTDNSWQFTADGPIVDSDYQMGETYDARKEFDWNDMNDTRWGACGTSAWDTSVKPTNGSLSGVSFQMSARKDEGARVERIIEPELTYVEKPTGAFIYDFGQNMVGTVRLTLKGEAGQKIKMRYGEMCSKDGLYTANLRTAKNTDIYTFKGDENGEVFEPTFTSHGFRYMEITGVDKPLTASDIAKMVIKIEGLVITNTSNETGTFEYSNSLVNQLYSNIMWGQRGNSLLVYTDCPQRNERMGWTGDAQVFAKTAAYHMDVRAFMDKWIQDVRDSQLMYNKNGAVPDTAPLGGDNRADGCGGWGDAGVIVPWEMYLAYGDKTILEENYDMMSKWVEYQSRSDRQNYGLRTVDGKAVPEQSDLATIPYIQVQQRRGDHLSYDNSTPYIYVATAYAAHCADIMAKAAEVLGKTSDAKKYRTRFENIKRAFNEAWVQEDGTIAYWGEMSAKTPQNEDCKALDGSTTRYTYYAEGTEHCPSQTTYALAIDFDLIPENKMAGASKGMEAALERNNDYLTVGFLGISHLVPALTKAGLTDKAFKLLENEDNPSWLYSVKNGATTIWERWNSYIAETDTFGDVSMNSFNHYSYGAIGEWMFSDILGIKTSENAGETGYKKIILEPTVGGSLTYAKGSYDSVSGEIVSDWKIDNNKLTYKCTVPANTTATLYLPTNNASAITESGAAAVCKSYENGRAVFELQSGSYTFETTIDENANEKQWLTINTSNGVKGRGTINGTVYDFPTSVCLKKGETVTITAADISDTLKFDAWSGAVTGNNKEITLTLDTDKTLTANYTDGTSAHNPAVSASGKYMHISFDDVNACLYDISTKDYKSVFENSFFNDLKSFHDTYGAVFTLNCFNTSTSNKSYDITKLPDRYKSELAANSDWLRFSFHAENDDANYGTNEGTVAGGTPTGDCPDEIKASYNKFTSAIINAAGEDSIDNVVRLGFFAGTKNNVKALMDCDKGITGLLAADDTRISYYLSADENNYLLSNGEYYDTANNIRLIQTQKRLEKASDVVSELGTVSAYNSNIIEIFTHEQEYDKTVKTRLGAYLQWAKDNGIGFGFAEDLTDRRIIVADKEIEADKLTYTVNVTDGLQGTLIGALYDTDGTLLKMTSNSSKKTQKIAFDLDENTNKGVTKFFLWNSLSDMTPIAATAASSWEYKEPKSIITLDKSTYPLYVGNASVTDFANWDGYGSYFTLTAAVDSDEYSENDIKWTINSDIAYFKSTNDNVAEIRARRTGIAKATATLPDGAKASCYIPVIDNASRLTVETMSFNTDELTLTKGQSAELKTIIYPKDIYGLGILNDNVTWSTSNSNVAAVSNGTISAVNAGTAIITATSADVGRTAQCIVTVTENGATAEITPAQTGIIDMTVGETTTLKATTDSDIIWKSDNSYIADVDENGAVTAYSNSNVQNVSSDGLTVTETAGTVKIYATAVNGGKVAEYQVRVANSDIADKYLEQSDGIFGKTKYTATTPTTTLSIDSEKEIDVDEVYQLVPTANGDSKLLWIGTDENIATVDREGNIQGYKAGEITVYAITDTLTESEKTEFDALKEMRTPDSARLTALLNGKTYAACEITVKDDTPCLRNVHIPIETITDTSVNILWNRASLLDTGDFDRYIVYNGNAKIAEITTLGYTVNNLEANTEYTFKVSAVDAKGKELASDTVTVTTKSAPTKILNVLDYGAKGDGTTIDTYAIQKAINDCPENGVVWLPEGHTFYSGALFLKSNMTFKVDGIILGSIDPKDYPRWVTKWEGWRKTEQSAKDWANTTDTLPENHKTHASLINAGKYDEGVYSMTGPYNVENLVICGDGQINANGFALAFNEGPNASYSSEPWTKYDYPVKDASMRGRAITIQNAKNVYIKDILVAYSPSWTVHTINCNNITFDGMEVVSQGNGNVGKGTDVKTCGHIPNGDGIDPESCTHVNMFNVLFSTGDDAVAMKTGRNKEGNELNKPNAYVRITDCTSSWSLGGFGTGSENAGGAHDLLFQNIKAENVRFYGIWLKTTEARGGVTENVQIRDMNVKVANAAVCMNHDYPSSTTNPANEKPVLRNVTIENVTSEGTTNGISVSGLSSSQIKDVKIRNYRNTMSNSVPSPLKNCADFEIWDCVNTTFTKNNSSDINEYSTEVIEDTAIVKNDIAYVVQEITDGNITVKPNTTVNALIADIKASKGGKQTYSVKDSQNNDITNEAVLTEDCKLIVTAQNGAKTAEYEIKVREAVNADITTLSIITDSGKELIFSDFVKNKTDYTIKTEKSVASVTLTAVKDDNGATVVMKNNGTEFDGTTVLAEGENGITLEVTASDNQQKKTYTINIDNSYSIAEDFSSVTDAWGFSGNGGASVTDGVIQLLTSKTTGHTVTKTLDSDISGSKKVSVEFDWKNNAASGKGNGSWLALHDSSDNMIFALYGNGKYVGIGASTTDTNKGWQTIEGFSNDWYRVSLELDFEAKTINGTITNITDNKVVKTYKNEPIQNNAANLGKLYAQDGYSDAVISLDNVYIKTAKTDDTPSTPTPTPDVPTSVSIDEDFESYKAEDTDWGFTGTGTATVTTRSLSNASGLDGQDLKLRLPATGNELKKELGTNISGLKQVEISFDWRPNGTKSGASGRVALFDSDGTPITGMYCYNKGDGGIYYLEPNTTSSTTKLISYGRTWCSVSLILDFEAHTMTGTIKNKSDNNKLLKEFTNEDITAKNLDSIIAASTYGDITMSLDNVVIKPVDTDYLAIKGADYVSAGKTYQYTAVENAHSEELIWAVSGAEGVTIDGNGLLTVSENAAGAATITLDGESRHAEKKITINAVDAPQYITVQATGNSTEVDTSTLYRNSNVTGLLVTTAKDGKIVKQNTVPCAPSVTVDTTGADNIEISNVYTYTDVSGAANGIELPDAFENGRYNLTFKKADTKHCDIYVNGYMVGNNVDQWGYGRSKSSGSEYTAKDIKVENGIVAVQTKDIENGGNGELSSIKVEKCPETSIADRKKRITIIGDSLVCNYYGNQSNVLGIKQTGWGQALSDFINTDEYEVVNLANSGYYAKTMYDTSFPSVIYNSEQGDIFLFEAGYNDFSYSNETEMAEYVNTMIDEAKTAGLNVILVSPNACVESYAYPVRLGNVMKECAEAKGVGFIDLSYASYTFLRDTYGDDTNAIKASVGLSSNDNTHSSYVGAYKYASFVANRLYKMGYETMIDTEFSYEVADKSGNKIKCNALIDAPTPTPTAEPTPEPTEKPAPILTTMIDEDFSSYTEDTDWGFTGTGDATVTRTDLSNASGLGGQDLKLRLPATDNELKKELGEDISALKQVDVSFDWRPNGTKSGVSGRVALFDSDGTPITGMFAWYGNGGGLYFLEPNTTGTGNGTDNRVITPYGRNWCTVSLKLDFEKGIMNGTIVKKDDGTTLKTFTNVSITAKNLNSIIATSTNGDITMSIDNVVIKEITSE